MKFTEGYWLTSERAKAFYAAEAYEVEEIPGGLRVLAPCKNIRSRGDTLNQPVLTLEFTSPAPDIIAVRTYHHAAYQSHEPRFAQNANPQPVTVSIGEDEAVMTAGQVTLRIDRRQWGYRFEAKGKLLTSCSFRGVSCMLWDSSPASVLPGQSYLQKTGESYMVTELTLQPGEYVYGLGERFSAFPKNGQTVDCWNEDGGTSSQISYKNIPFYMTNKNYGIFVDHAGPVSFEVASEKVERVGFSIPGEELRYCLIYGETPRDITRGYTGLLGRPALPPAWSFGLWLSTSFTTDYDEATATSFIQGMADREIPLSVFHFDCFWMKGFRWCDFTWDSSVTSDPKGMLARYHERGLRICVWINPYIAQASSLFQEAAERGFLLERADGRGVYQLDLWQAGLGLVDFTNPAACDWYAGKLEQLLDMGVDCFKTDFGERIPVEVRYHNGADPLSMHNYYTELYNRCVFDLLKRKRGEGEAVLFARSATAGGQQYPVHWGGDCSASFISMAETLRGGLSLMMSGFAFWSHDISGFESTATPDLYKRWIAFGLLSSHSRLHGSGSYRVPWLFDEEASQVLRFFSRLKCRLMPYLFAAAVDAHREGVPLLRPMVYEFPKDPAVPTLDMQYLLGDSLLIAPIFSEDGEVDYYLPAGRWIHLLDGQELEGGRWYHDHCDYFTLPLFVRPNALLPMGTMEERPDYDYAAALELHLYAPEDNLEKTVVVPTLQGNPAMTIRLSKENDQLAIRLEGTRPTALPLYFHGTKRDGAPIQLTEALTLISL